MSLAEPSISVVIATRDRPERVRRVAGQVIEQLRLTDELIVVDDSNSPSDSYEWIGHHGQAIASGGQGPAVARNLGWRVGSRDIVAFTDDDVFLDREWLNAIRAEFAADLTLVAVEGRTVSRSFDPLYEYSVRSERALNGLTCNIAYRRSALERLEGFDERFPFAHCEDKDLFARAAVVGNVKFARTVLVDHAPRPIHPRVFARRARWLRSECLLYAKHPHLRPYPLPPAICAVLDYARWPVETVKSEVRTLNLRRALRAAELSVLWWSHLARALPSALLAELRERSARRAGRRTAAVGRPPKESAETAVCVVVAEGAFTQRTCDHAENGSVRTVPPAPEVISS